MHHATGGTEPASTRAVAGLYTGVVENILGRVLDAFQARLAAIAGSSAAGRLADSVALVRLMVREPSAALLGSPVAFFVGGNTGGWVGGGLGAG